MTKTDTVEHILETGVSLLATMALGLRDSDGDTITSTIGSNANVQYISEQFALRDFCWCDFGSGFSDEDPDPETSIHPTPDGHCPPNFEHFASGLQLRWYKHIGRSHEWENLPASRDDAIQVLLDCMKPLVAKKPSLPRETRKSG